MKLDVEALAARWVLEAIEGRELPEAAISAPSDGFDGPALRELAGETDPSRSEVSRLVERALGELGAPRLSRRESAMILAARVAAQIVEGSLEPSEGAELIWRLQVDVPEVDHALDAFVYWASELEDADDEERQRICREAILASARDFGGHSA